MPILFEYVETARPLRNKVELLNRLQAGQEGHVSRLIRRKGDVPLQ
jgi:hypothetical protein